MFILLCTLLLIHSQLGRLYSAEQVSRRNTIATHFLCGGVVVNLLYVAACFRSSQLKWPGGVNLTGEGLTLGNA